jgi:hypothetical protein
MDFVKDGGVVWRQRIKHDLKDLGIIWMDPIQKPIAEGIEDSEHRKLRSIEKRAGHFDTATQMMQPIKDIDLRMVDVSDFIICHIDFNAYSVGTWNEVFRANTEGKPILVHCEQGKAEAPDWLLATIPHQMIFSKWKELYTYLRSVAYDSSVETYNRWKFFDYGMVYDLDTIKVAPSFEAKISPEDWRHLNQWCWCVTPQSKVYRAMRKTRIKGKTKTIYMHQEIIQRMGLEVPNAKSNLTIDHVNQDPLDNRRDNLRIVTKSRNLHNRGAQTNSSTGIKGVWYHKQRGKYIAEIKIQGRKYTLGAFNTTTEANAALNDTRKRFGVD